MKPIHIADHGQGWSRFNIRQHPKLFIYHNKCKNADHYRIKVYNDRDYSKLECDKLCVSNDQCKAFMWGTRGQISGDCELYNNELKNC